MNSTIKTSARDEMKPVSALMALVEAALRPVIEQSGRDLTVKIKENITSSGRVKTGRMRGSVTAPMDVSDGLVIGTEVGMLAPYTASQEKGFTHYQSKRWIEGAHFAQRAAWDVEEQMYAKAKAAFAGIKGAK